MTDERTAVHSRTYRILLALDAIPRKFAEFKRSGFAAAAPNRSETSFFHGCLQNATRHSFSFGYFISIFRVSSLFITLLALLARPLFFPSFFLPPFSCLLSPLQDFSGAPLARFVSCSSRGYDESSDLLSFVFVTLNILLAWHIYYSSEIYSEKRIAPLEKCRLHAHKFDFK